MRAVRYFPKLKISSENFIMPHRLLCDMEVDYITYANDESARGLFSRYDCWEEALPVDSKERMFRAMINGLLHSLPCNNTRTVELKGALQLLFRNYNTYNGGLKWVAAPHSLQETTLRTMERVCPARQRLRNRERLYVYAACMARKHVEVPVDVARRIYRFSPTKTVDSDDPHVVEIMCLGCSILADQCDADADWVAVVDVSLMAMRQHPDSCNVGSQACAALCRALSFDGTCGDAIVAAGGLETIMETLTRPWARDTTEWPDYESMLIGSFKVLQGVAGDSDVKDAIVALGALETICVAMRRRPRDDDTGGSWRGKGALQAEGLAVLAVITCGSRREAECALSSAELSVP